MSVCFIMVFFLIREGEFLVWYFFGQLLITNQHPFPAPLFPIHICSSIHAFPLELMCFWLSWLYITGVYTRKFHSLFYMLSVKVIDSDNPDNPHRHVILLATSLFLRWVHMTQIGSMKWERIYISDLLRKKLPLLKEIPGERCSRRDTLCLLYCGITFSWYLLLVSLIYSYLLSWLYFLIRQ